MQPQLQNMKYIVASVPLEQHTIERLLNYTIACTLACTIAIYGTLSFLPQTTLVEKKASLSLLHTESSSRLKQRRLR